MLSGSPIDFPRKNKELALDKHQTQNDDLVDALRMITKADFIR